MVAREAGVGWRVRVYWEGDDEWFEGIVREYSPESGYYVEYDDGEKQWEAENAEFIEFLSKPGEREIADAQLILQTQEREEETEEGQQGRQAWSAEPPPSTADAYEDEYESDHEEQEEQDSHREQDATVQVAVRTAESPKPELEESPVRREPVTSKEPSRPSVRDPTKYVKSGVFFRDAESLREAKAALQKEKATLMAQYEALVDHLQQKEVVSTQLKRELTGLKAQVTLAEITGPANAQRAAPKTPREWSERIVEQKLANRNTRSELAGMQLQIHQTKTALHQAEKQREQLQVRLERVPRRDLATLVDVQMEIAQLMSEKREMEAQMLKAGGEPKPTANKTRTTRDLSTPPERKEQLEKELRLLDKRVAQAANEVDEWRLACEKENARIAPLKSRLESLQHELRKYEKSQVLLRSLFLRLDRHGTGIIPLDLATDTFTLLSSKSSRRDDLAARLQRITPQVPASLDMAAFTQCFNELFVD